MLPITAAGGQKVAITQSDMQTNPNSFEPPLWTYPVILTTPAAGGVVEVLAE